MEEIKSDALMGMVLIVVMGTFHLFSYHRLLNWMDRRGDLSGYSALKDFRDY